MYNITPKIIKHNNIKNLKILVLIYIIKNIIKKSNVSFPYIENCIKLFVKINYKGYNMGIKATIGNVKIYYFILYNQYVFF